MDRTIFINAEHRETRVALIENSRLVELHVEQKKAESAVGNVYLGKVINTVPAIQAAFVDLGLERHGFLHLGDLRLPGVDIERNPKIGQVLTKGQKLLVQVQKDPIATKGFKLSMDISLPGRYSVLMPLTHSAGVSRSIQDPEERKRLRSIRREAGVEDLGVIIRTVAEGKPKSEVARDLRYLMRLWKALQEAAGKIDEPGIVYREPDLVEKTLRDAYKQAETRIVVDDEPCRQRIIRFLSLYYPRHEFIAEVLLHNEPVPLFKKFGLDRELEMALHRRVELESGGFLLLEESETLTAIDVNSGKLTKTSGPEETAVRTNIEAAEEIGRQLRLRDIGGMIIVDFIQMSTKKQRNRVYNALKKALSHDRSRTKISNFSDLELVQITRRRVRESLEHQMTEDCPYCKGEGTIFSKETSANQVIRDLKETLFTYFPTVVKIWVNPEVYHLLMEDQKYLRDLGHKIGTSVVLIPDPDRHIPDYSLRPEGIPVVLAASPESRHLRQDLLARFEREAASGGAPTLEMPAAAPTESLGEILAPPPESLEAAPIGGTWGDRQMEEEVQAAALAFEAAGAEEEEEEDEDEEEEEELEETFDEEEPVAADNGRRRAEPPAPSAAEPPEPSERPAGVEEEAAWGGDLPPRLSFRARASSLRFSSRRDLRRSDFGRQYELWSVSKPPAEAEPSAETASAETQEPGSEETQQRSKGRRRKPRRRSRTTKDGQPQQET
jgi:ribonuclease G